MFEDTNKIWVECTTDNLSDDIVGLMKITEKK